ncbi:PAS domain S-box-containing protein [Desulfomicrobium apsheronum]|uniref:histidine kinase n=1 Tax=Desulfomicrobium apsheronum TaxID=52560 RepID=A0A1I3WZ58_9BACT|nr:PAS domain S-box protein [Desulfomicrobium apsheronum]SFK12167.1 PAS domain S-box-containing protein [Desulfomicrobium apsheronum]
MDRNGVGGRLRLYRQLRNLTQESLSEVIGVTKQHLGQIERGQCNPSLDFLSKAASALDTHIASFFLGNGNDSVMFNAHSFPEGDGGVRPFSTCGLWMLSGPGGKNIWSKSLCRMLGHTSVRVPSLTQFCKHLTTDAAVAFRAFFAQVLEGDVPDSMIFAVTRKDGVQRKVQAVAEILNGDGRDDPAETAYIIFWDMTDWLETRRIYHYTQQELNDTIRDRTAALSSAVLTARRELELRQDAERAVQQAHGNLSRLVQTIPVIVYSRSFEGSTTYYCSPQAHDVLGYNPGESDTSGGFWTDRIHPEDAALYQAALEQASRSGSLDVEYRVLNEAGRVMWLHDKAVMTDEGDGLVMHGVATDITQQKNEIETRKALERKSMQLDTMLRLICDNVPDMIWAKDLEKKYIFANKAVCETLLGACDTSEPIGKTDLFFAQRERARYPGNPDWHSFGEICRDTDQITIDSAGAKQFDEYGNIAGKFLFLDVRKAPLFDENGAMIGTVGSARDVTVQKRMEKELEAGNIALRAILDSIPADICVLDVDTDEVLFMNASMRESSEKFGSNPHDCQQPHGRSEGLHPDRDEAGDKTLSWEALDPQTGKWNLYFDRPVSWFDGRPARIRIAMDISARMQAQTLLKKAAEEQQLLLENIQTQVWYLTDEQTYGAVNGAHAAFGGLAMEDMAYRDIYDIYPADVADICRQGNERVFFSGRPVRTEEWFPHFSGDRRLVSILKSPKLRSDGTVEYVVCSAEDITERWRSEEALKKAKELAEEASRVKSGFLASMSHEIRTPINGIMGMLQLLQTTELSADQDAFVDMAVRSCDRLVRLLSDIMDFSRIEAGKLIIQAAPMSLESVFGQVRELFTPFLQDTKVTLDFTLDPALPCRILGDAFRLQQILNNLVDNACKFTSGGSVSVQAFRLPTVVPGTVRIFFEVSDTGIGIPDDELKSLFDPFIQINDGYVRSRKGVGLGLSICKRLVELMGGSMSVISEAGKGTAFVFSLSFAMDSTLDHPGGVDDRQATNLSGRRILLVEDDQVSAMAQQALLARHGGEVIHVRGGQEALDTLRVHPFDLVVMDVQMQDMDGIEATMRIRRGEAGEMLMNIPVIALTACAMVGDREHFLAAGMNAYVAKPMDIREMLCVAGRILKG